VQEDAPQERVPGVVQPHERVRPDRARRDCRVERSRARRRFGSSLRRSGGVHLLGGVPRCGEPPVAEVAALLAPAPDEARIRLAVGLARARAAPPVRRCRRRSVAALGTGEVEENEAAGGHGQEDCWGGPAAAASTWVEVQVWFAPWRWVTHDDDADCPPCCPVQLSEKTASRWQHWRLAAAGAGTGTGGRLRRGGAVLFALEGAWKTGGARISGNSAIVERGRGGGSRTCWSRSCVVLRQAVGWRGAIPANRHRFDV